MSQATGASQTRKLLNLSTDGWAVAAALALALLVRLGLIQRVPW